MVEIKCLRCKQEFQIGKEQLAKIREIAIGIMKPKDYLRFFPLISSECKDGKGHDFVFTDAFSDTKKEVIQTYDDEHGNKYETRATVNFKERKIIKQEFKKLKVVKDVGDKHPKILIDEKVIDWGKEK